MPCRRRFFLPKHSGNRVPQRLDHYSGLTSLEPQLFKAVTGLTVDDFNLLVSLNVFNSAHMNQAVFAFRRYEDASLSYTGIDSHEGLSHYGLYDTVVARE
ncbi:hypothetical protein QGN32_06560 [Mycolicibacterium sp. ND9-15]|uniref:hypothetical protein n=1 Tax=Mycolicibacterium sp. ND9-15 TaxID=3042320 RepID=UPI002DD9E2D6|nr:hypothetical protein [Mycolicibacterium sp. ND9-15]WSE57537.1 hypothetical protein QGN32_06560 [Mycolicibacterium sp. ND9-15]